ncbi:hypothetical protein EYR38_009093 [Pleurotus pulmonarius]|nr:hypothetical protein EYR38_009093 [Pleurotus pulmonarius]
MVTGIAFLTIFAVIVPIDRVKSFPAVPPTTLPSRSTGRLPALGQAFSVTTQVERLLTFLSDRWNSWNAYRCDINENKTLAAANQFVSLGLKDVGYEYVNIDDCWSRLSRDTSTKRIIPDSIKFPNGIDTVASKIHDLGLKMGIYSDTTSDAGTATCAGYPGSLGFEAIDAATFSEWGIDLPRLLHKSIQFSFRCAYGEQPMSGTGAHGWVILGEWAATRGKLPTWSYITSIININIAHLSSINFFAHNDMDMMEIGNGALTIQEQRTHFAAWIMLKSPILLGTDLDKLNSTQLAIIKNKDLLAFHQDDAVGTPAAPFTARSGAPVTSPPEFYSGKSSKGTHVFIINTSTSRAFKVHDMWTGQDLSGTYSSSFSTNIAAHDTAAFLITPA